MNEPNLNIAQDDATESSDSELVLVFDEKELEEELEGDGWTPDPVDEQIAAYLDDEMSPEEREAFELKVKGSETLQAKLDEERSAWNALSLLEVEKPSQDLTESTLGRLNAETQAELREVTVRVKRRRLTFYAAACLGAGVFLVFGYFLFSRFFPDLQRQRRQDCQVVDRLEQLGAVDNFDYLRAIADSKLFAPASEENSAPQDSGRRLNVNFFLQDFRPQPKKTFEELSQDRAFYRRQLQFENLAENEKQKYRDLYRLIESSTNAEALWTTANAYAFWLATAVNDSEIEQIQEMSIPDRIEAIRGRLEFFKRMQEFYSQSRASNFNGSRPPGDARRQERDSRFNESRAPGSASPTALAVRLTLPEDLRFEDLAPIYRQYEEFRNQRGTDTQNDSRQSGVFTFLKDTDSQKLLDLLSPKAKSYLLELSDADRASALGLLVTLSFLENNGANNRGAGPNGQNGNRQAQGGPRPFGGNNMFGDARWGRQWRFERNDFAPQNQNTVENLAKTLHDAPNGVKSYIVSNTPQSAMAALLGLHWNSGRKNEGAQPGAPNVGKPSPPPRPNDSFTPPDARQLAPFPAPVPAPSQNPQSDK